MAKPKLKLLEPFKVRRGLSGVCFLKGGVNIIETTLLRGSERIDSLMVRVAISMICSSIGDKLDLKDKFMMMNLTEKGDLVSLRDMSADVMYRGLASRLTTEELGYLYNLKFVSMGAMPDYMRRLAHIIFL